MNNVQSPEYLFARAVDEYRENVDPHWIDILVDLNILTEIVEARGSRLIDRSGREFLDFIAIFGAAVLGHNNPFLRNSIIEALNEGTPSVQSLGVSLQAAKLAHTLCELTGQQLTKVHFASTGAEAIEHCLRVAMIVTGRQQCLSWSGGFHGLTLNALRLVSCDSPWRTSSLAHDGFSIVEDLADLEVAERCLRSREIAAVVIEVVQGLGGCKSYERLRSLQELCESYGTLLVVDEVLTGLGRTGEWFAYQNVLEPVIPDLVVVSKGLSCGISPISAVLMREDIWDYHSNETGRGLSCTSTLAGNLLSVTVGLAALDLIERDDVIQNVRRSGERIVKGLQKLKWPSLGVGDIRGKGLLLAFSIEHQGRLKTDLAAACWRGLLNRGVLTSIAAHAPEFIKLTPPLTIGIHDIDQFIDALADSLSELKSSEI